jgi:hypothetical protein
MKLQMNRGTDEVNHGGVRYTVSNIDWTVKVPDHVGHVLLATGAGAVRLDAPPQPEPEGIVRVRHATDGDASFSHGQTTYEPDDQGVLTVPAAALPHLAAHGFSLIPEEGTN